MVADCRYYMAAALSGPDHFSLKAKVGISTSQSTKKKMLL